MHIFTDVLYTNIYTEREMCVYICIIFLLLGVFFAKGCFLSESFEGFLFCPGVFCSAPQSGIFPVLIQPGTCAFQQVAWVCGHNAGGSDLCKVCISRLISAHLAWWSSTAKRIAWVCGHNAEGSELFPFASQYF